MKKNLTLLFLLIPLCGWAKVVKDEGAHAVFDSNTGTLTFRYGAASIEIPDEQESYGYDDYVAQGIYMLDWASCWDEQAPYSELPVKYVVFDSSFSVVKRTSLRNFFRGLSSIEEIEGIQYLDTSNVTDMAWMFCGCDNLWILDLSKFNTSKVTTMEGMFWGCSYLTSLNVSSFDTRNVTNMKYMFAYCRYRLTSLDLSNFDTRNVTNMSDMFMSCEVLTELDLSRFNTSKVTTMEGMFGGCWYLTSLNVSSFDTRNVTDMSYMFSDCENLASLNLSNFDTRNVTAMEGMFNRCYSLTNLDVSHFDTRNVKTMLCMFADCWKNLTSLDVSNFDTRNVTDMRSMFDNCASLNILDLSSFDTSKVEDMAAMFKNCKNLKTIYVSDKWNTDRVKSWNGRGNNVFANTESLVGGKGTVWDDQHTDYTYARIDGGTDSPGYLTAAKTGTSLEDVNGDGVVNEIDIEKVVNHIMGHPSDDFNENAADVNNDGKINAADLVLIINRMKK